MSCAGNTEVDTPSMDRIARAENFVEDGTIDVRRD